MKEAYNSHIIIFTDCHHADIPRLRAKAESLGRVTIRASQKGKREVEVDGLYSELLEEGGISIKDAFKVKMIVRNPDRDYHDINDETSINRSVTTSDGLRAAPFFFRSDGSAVDIVSLYRDQHAFLIMNGGSVNQHDLEILQSPGVMTMGVNNGSHIIRTNLWACVDEPYRFMPSVWMDPRIMKFVPHAHFHKRIIDLDQGKPTGVPVASCPNVLGYRRNERFNHEEFLTESTINWGNHGSLGGGRSVMLASLRILHLLGFRTVYLLGCDFHMSQDNKYFFAENRDARAIQNNSRSYELMTGYFRKLRPVFDKAGFEVYNLNPESSLRVFPFMPFEQAVVRATRTILPELQRDTVGMYVKRT